MPGNDAPGGYVPSGVCVVNPNQEEMCPMKVDLESALKSLGLPFGLVAVCAAVLALFGVALEVVVNVASSMVGLQVLIGLLIDVLKWAGVVKDGTAGQWSAALNLLGLAGIAVALGISPAFDFGTLDARFIVVGQFAALLFAYVVQVVGTKSVHSLLVEGLGIRAFSHSG